MRLAEFLVLVSTSPDALTGFISDPSRAMRGACLSEEDQFALQSCAAQLIYRRIVGADVTQNASSTPPEERPLDGNSSGACRH
jgi:hypothetical protein